MPRPAIFAPPDLDRIGNTIGQLAVAKVLFKPRIETEAVQAIASAVLGDLKLEPAAIAVISDMTELPADRVASWATQCWLNVVGELCAVDPEMEKAFSAGNGYLPHDPVAVALYKKKLAERFFCFLWIAGWRGAVSDVTNCFSIRLIVLDGVIRIENLESKVDGAPGGWGILDSTVNAARLIAATTQQRVKTIATNARIEAAFRRRGFIDSVSSKYMHTEKARPLELIPAPLPGVSPTV